MFRALAVCGMALVSGVALADGVNLVEYKAMEIPITPFSNMASGYQATNPGFRAILKDRDGAFLAGGPLTMDAVISGYSDDATKGSPYGRLVLSVEMTEVSDALSRHRDGEQSGVLSICMAADPGSAVADTECRKLGGNIHPDRPFQWLDKKVRFTAGDNGVRITRYEGSTGEGGTPEQLSLAIFHPAFGFAAPGKAFKDYQSPLILDLDHDGKLGLVNVWDESRIIRFDFNGTGVKVRTGWVGAKDGLLFLDDGSGCVHDGTQLFGEYTGSRDGQRTYSDGFAALAAKLDPRHTGKVVAARHPELKIWRNVSQDGVCKRSEVFPAARFVKTLLVASKAPASHALVEDNEIRLVGHYFGRDGRKHVMGDVWFKQRRNEIARN